LLFSGIEFYMANSTALKQDSSVDRIVLDVLKCGVEITNRSQVEAYLNDHGDLAGIVPIVCAQGRKEFGEEAGLNLCVYRDPEIDDQYLSLYVRLPATGQAGMERVERFSRTFDDQLCEASGYLLISADFRTPRAL
jgi:hypothetical protein